VTFEGGEEVERRYRRCEVEVEEVG